MEEGEVTSTKSKASEDKVSDEEEKAGKTGLDTEEDKVEEEDFVDAKEECSITSSTSKTQHAAGGSQHGTAKDAVPHPIEKEGGQEVAAASGHGDG